MKKYLHIFFDLDHTLWDFDRCSEETVYELIEKYQLHLITKKAHIDFIQTFKKVNNKLWYLYHLGKITKKGIRDERFKIIFNELNIDLIHLPNNIGKEYLEICPCKPYLIEDAIEVLDYLAERYDLHILTNGFEDVQEIKLTNSGIRDYFKCIITSESTGKTKPHKEIFDFALSHSKAELEQSIMIGDNLKTDILGAYQAGMDSIYYNPVGKKQDHTALYEIKKLLELKGIL
ncbi:YjjG family noncanonical pyrimidine nucleotidase [Chondrinema litorale]|uniref:YjjG family noncanonical pyrimidine nucleotidase n=1 Tax=Chondrinema litorale TaxID=2994555 RepID=UPI002543841F|nr:YjjG family noncanonical pyrimidine nucleotidase [Chondrinema litorale]UZR92749.1 YjjG family noncanonical pyrimidine nucleotidase [Chondrinema litorale]